MIFCTDCLQSCTASVWPIGVTLTDKKRETNSLWCPSHFVNSWLHFQNLSVTHTRRLFPFYFFIFFIFVLFPPPLISPGKLPMFFFPPLILASHPSSNAPLSEIQEERWRNPQLIRNRRKEVKSVSHLLCLLRQSEGWVSQGETLLHESSDGTLENKTIK